MHCLVINNSSCIFNYFNYFFLLFFPFTILGESTIHSKVSDAFFDIIDQDKNGVITLDELKMRMKAFGMPEDAAKPFLEMADTNKNGVIERQELYEADFNFWFGNVDEKYDQLYGGLY